MTRKLKGSDLIHGDAHLNSDERPEVMPSISMATTFRVPPDPDALLIQVDSRNPKRHIYSRYTQDISTRAEHILSKINDGYALTYASGLAACYAAMLHHKPKRVAIRGGYWGTHQTLQIYQKSKDAELPVIDLDDEFQPGDICWLETPVNPTGESRDIKYYAEKIHKVGGKLIVDSTLAPPPLQYPFKLGADCIVHSGTKYLGGHSDLLCGVLVVQSEKEWSTLMADRTYMGTVMGSLEAWLLLRSLRTLHLRVTRQSETAAALAQWLQLVVDKTSSGQSYDGVPPGLLAKVFHSSLQKPDARGFDPRSQMEGWNATFAIHVRDPETSLLAVCC
ncbi:cystathionine gamma-synthase [Moniliophthora roreri MCA 2997]|uniref:Cystathionine gamma-synthase n=1 Tax=Moniliophthora roreri (strain MCA 2997) TaxID=1381753 RepID=V2Z134_MONRO|nr:cystathionine gamma-synthase [Moniliophthora roreri MCA 2997]